MFGDVAWWPPANACGQMLLVSIRCTCHLMDDCVIELLHMCMAPSISNKLHENMSWFFLDVCKLLAEHASCRWSWHRALQKACYIQQAQKSQKLSRQWNIKQHSQIKQQWARLGFVENYFSALWHCLERLSTYNPTPYTLLSRHLTGTPVCPAYPIASMLTEGDALSSDGAQIVQRLTKELL